MEIEISCQNGIPLIALVEQGLKISKMIEGVANLIQVINYQNLEDLESRLAQALSQFSVDRKIDG